MPLDQLPAVLQSIGNTPGLLKEIYGDLAKPGVTQVGKALSTVLGLSNTLLLPLTLINEKARMVTEHNLEKYRKQLESVQLEQIASVPPEIGVPVTEKLTYVTDEIISDLYVNLLAKASTIGNAQQAHPSFFHLIDSLSPDEALLIKELRKTGDLAFIEVRMIVDKATNAYFTVLPSLRTGVEHQVKLLFPNNCDAYFSNLSGLGVLNIRYDIRLAADELYKRLKQIYDSEINAIQLDHDKQLLKVVEGKIEITPYGHMFINACGTKLNET